MLKEPVVQSPQLIENEWIEFPGGELEGTRPSILCPACRERLKKAATLGNRRSDAAGGAPTGGSSPCPDPSRRAPLCFQCYRAQLDRHCELKAAGELGTASEERLQFGLPFEPVNKPRLEMLRADRSAARLSMQAGPDRFADKRRHAQIAARHALQRIAAGLGPRAGVEATVADLQRQRERDRILAAVAHAAELQLPESWLPFVMSR